MSSYVDPHTGTAFARTDWAHYATGRPAYPASLRDLIYAYRRKHGGAAGWTRLVDLGAGTGTGSTLFMADFDTVHVSDPSPANQGEARTFLAAWAAAHGLATQLEFSQSRAEEAAAAIPPGSADMVIVATAAHFVDPDQLVAAIARLLRPGGTLAIFGYWTPAFPDQTARFGEVFVAALGDAQKATLPAADGERTRAAFETAYARLAAGEGGTETIPLPADLFDDPQRVRFNWDPDSKLQFYRFLNCFWPADALPSRVAPTDARFDYRTGTHPEAAGWEVVVDKAWLYRYQETFRSTDRHLTPDQEAAVFGDWERIFAEECPSGKVRTVWPAQLLLATRRA